MDTLAVQIGDSLYQGRLVYFAPIDPEKDVEVEAKWTQDASFQRGFGDRPARPVSAVEVKKRYEKLGKEIAEGNRLFHFAIHSRADERLIGFAQIAWIEWTHGNGWVKLGLGLPEDRRKGYGTDALQLLLRFAFTELNLFRLSAWIPSHNEAALRLFSKAGFLEEARKRQAIWMDGRHWDLVYTGILREEWQG